MTVIHGKRAKLSISEDGEEWHEVPPLVDLTSRVDLSHLFQAHRAFDRAGEYYDMCAPPPPPPPKTEGQRAAHSYHQQRTIEQKKAKAKRAKAKKARKVRKKNR